MAHFTSLVDLASERLGGKVLYANDDFFAPKESLLKVDEAVFIADRYTDRGKWMDGWESRRRRTSGHDFCIVELGFAGVIRGVDVDTSHFKGNYPEACSVEAVSAEGGAPVDSLGGPTAPWHEIVPKTSLRGDTRNLFPVFDRGRYTHVRLQIHPDGGVARLRVHGEVVPDWRRLSMSAEPIDLCALANGGLVLASSDSFFGSHQSLLMPDRAPSMKDGWETKRSRRPGYDWVILRLGTRGVIREVELDTNHFKGNFPAGASLEVCDAPGAEVDSLTDPRREWRPLLPESPLSAHTRHQFGAEHLQAGAGTHVRLRIYPDGGISRLRLFGEPAPPEALKRLNRATLDEATAELARCCGAGRWAGRLAAMRPFASHLDLFRGAEEVFDGLAEKHWLEAFAAHPRIGDRKSLAAHAGSTRSWAEGEQTGTVAAPKAVLDELAAGNETYEVRFGHAFILCATGQPAFRMLASLKDRLSNPADIELRVAAEEQRRITRLRLEKLMTSSSS